ncbi:MAG: hypothetical protein KGL04_09455 [Elusimicrobia bacterium]|nr:hypothetical protein [Elusimicrobiota bacterium]
MQAAGQTEEPDFITTRLSTISVLIPGYAQVEPQLAWGQRPPAGCPASGLWLKAAYYGADAQAIHVGMRGRFKPAGTDGPRGVPVKVCAVFSLLRSDGGESVALAASTPRPGWMNGMFGTVDLKGPVESLIAIPTRALIVDQGAWWVLVRDSQGQDVPRQVVPGPSRGWRTFIKRGLKAGEKVVVVNAYLKFHRNVSKNYQPPD